MTPRAKTALRLAGSLILLALVAWQIGAGQVWDGLRAASLVWVGLAVVALALQIPLSAWRWQITAQALGVPISGRIALREYGLSVLVNTFLPGGVLGDLARVARMRGQAGLGVAAASVVIERLLGQIAMALAALVGVTLWFGPVAAGLAMLGALGVGVLAFALGRIMPRVQASLRQALLGADWPRQVLLSVAIVGCNLFGFWAAARSVGVALPLSSALLVLPLTLLVMLIPITLNGWGLREGAAALLWPLVGVAAEVSVAASVVFGLAVAVAALIGAVPVVFGGQGAAEGGR